MGAVPTFQMMSSDIHHGHTLPSQAVSQIRAKVSKRWFHSWTQKASAVLGSASLKKKSRKERRQQVELIDVHLRHVYSGTVRFVGSGCARSGDTATTKALISIHMKWQTAKTTQRFLVWLERMYLEQYCLALLR